jgi:hypothetical protein
MESSLTAFEWQLIRTIKEKTTIGNLHNISRTVCYEDFYQRNKEIRWAFLASMVSRNAGWSMTDLETNVFRQLLKSHQRKLLFLTYERANWLIFSDAYPQLLIYEASKKEGKPLFHLLKHFGVSSFIISAWKSFWNEKNIDLLVISQIINEQHVIEKPVIQHRFFKKKVFQSFSYRMQDLLHFSVVIFPALDGELYGFSVHDFTDVKERVKIGKYLYWLLFYAKERERFHIFSSKTVPTGSRKDYEQYRNKVIRVTPTLLDTFPIISHNKRNDADWYNEKMKLTSFFDNIKYPKKYHISHWFEKKQYELSLLATIQHKLANTVK